MSDLYFINTQKYDEYRAGKISKEELMKYLAVVKNIADSCNLHDDCRAADRVVLELNGRLAYHCYKDGCTTCSEE